MVAAAVIILGLVWFTYTSHREPRYKGKSLTEWLRLYNFDPATSEQWQADAAVRHIGTNALPFLLKWVDQYQPMSSWRRRLWTRVADWEPGTPGRELLTEVIGGRQLRAGRAIWGFKILAETAQEAAPELQRIATRGDTMSASVAIDALPYLGRDGLHPVLSVISNTALPLQIRYRALISISGFPYSGTNAHPAVPLLIRCLQEADLAVNAADQLGDLRLEPNISVPALVECTRSTNQILRMHAAESLGHFGEGGRVAVPALTALLHDPVADVRIKARNALWRIAP